MNCIFCKIINNEIPSYKLYEDELVIAFLDVNPVSCGHTLIVPKEHFQDLDDISQDILNHIMKVAKNIKNELYDKLGCNGLTLVQNNGKVQEVKHYHLHLQPFYENEKQMSIEEVYNILKK